jgi:hypothetical protein
MSAPLVPSPLDYVGRRKFAFYPPIAHPDPNEWMLGTGSRSEVQVVNARTGREIWISRQYIGAVSETSSPLLIVGLTKALKFREGTVEPRVKRVIEMPPAPRPQAENSVGLSHRPSHPASVTAIRLESRSDSALNKAMIFTFISAIVVALVAALVAGVMKF